MCQRLSPSAWSVVSISSIGSSSSMSSGSVSTMPSSSAFSVHHVPSPRPSAHTSARKFGEVAEFKHHVKKKAIEIGVTATLQTVAQLAAQGGCTVQ